jgi:hypothetical protein
MSTTPESQRGENSSKEQVNKKLTDYISTGGVLGIVIGAVAGYLYYYYIGCRSGSCPINSNPYISTVYGMILGYLVGDIFKKRKNTGRPQTPPENG